VRRLPLLIAVTLPAAPAPAADSWQECQIENVTFCNADGCRYVDPTLKLYFGDFADSRGKRKSYYYRCRRDRDCDRIENPWIGENERYRAFVMPEQGVIARIAADGKVTDVATVDDTVLISRGSCWEAGPQTNQRK